MRQILEHDRIRNHKQYGRTPLHYVIVQKAPIELLEELVRLGADLYIQDKLHDTALEKAIKFNNVSVIKVMLDKGMDLDHPKGVLYTYWFRARHNPAVGRTARGTLDK